MSDKDALQELDAWLDEQISVYESMPFKGYSKELISARASAINSYKTVKFRLQSLISRGEQTTNTSPAGVD